MYKAASVYNTAFIKKWLCMVPELERTECCYLEVPDGKYWEEVISIKNDILLIKVGTKKPKPRVVVNGLLWDLPENETYRRKLKTYLRINNKNSIRIKGITYGSDIIDNGKYFRQRGFTVLEMFIDGAPIPLTKLMNILNIHELRTLQPNISMRGNQLSELLKLPLRLLDSKHGKGKIETALITTVDKTFIDKGQKFQLLYDCTKRLPLNTLPLSDNLYMLLELWLEELEAYLYDHFDNGTHLPFYFNQYEQVINNILKKVKNKFITMAGENFIKLKQYEKDILIKRGYHFLEESLDNMTGFEWTREY